MPILIKIRNYRTQWKEHLERMDRNRILKAAMQYKPKEKRDRANPRKRWIEDGTDLQPSTMMDMMMMMIKDNCVKVNLNFALKTASIMSSSAYNVLYNSQ